MELGLEKENSKLAEKRRSLEGCIKTLLAIEGGDFPDEGCLECDNLKKCLKLEPEVRRGLVEGR